MISDLPIRTDMQQEGVKPSRCSTHHLVALLVAAAERFGSAVATWLSNDVKTGRAASRGRRRRVAGQADAPRPVTA